MGEDVAIAGTDPDPELIVTAADFARELQALRDRSGLTIREVARTAGTPLSTTGDYFSGKHLPLDREQFARVLAACGERDRARIERWQLALSRARRLPGRRGEAPYRGLARFEAADTKWFFGREDVAGQLASLAAMPSDLPLLLVGPSGAGKSSLLRAGLLPRLEDWGGTVTVVDLTMSGMSELSDVVAKLAALAEPAGGAVASATHRGDWRAALIMDQFEAVFTECDDEGERRALITALCELARVELVVLALRADFYEQAIRYPGLLQALRERHVVLGPMTAEQVRRAVVEPARLARADVDESLVGLLLADLAPRSGADGDAGDAYEPGALPLLSHAMLATWEHSRGGTLAVADYVASGGIRNALTRTAERAYESLSDHQRLLARRLFLRLVHVADEAPPSRASVALSELPGWSLNREARDGDRDERADAERVLATFVGERMITVDADAAQITHDALLAGWPRLRSWIADSAAELRDRGRIADGARAWAEAGREDAALWRGSRLALVREWAADPDKRRALPGQALEFVEACVAAGTASERAARRRTRGLQGTVAVLSALVLAVAGLTGYAFSQRAAARGAEGAALHAERAAVTEADMADSRDVAFTADQLRGQDPVVAAQFSLGGYGIARTPQATAGLLESTGVPTAARIVDSAGIVQWASVSPDHQLLAAAGADGTLRLWNVAKPGHPVPLATLAGADKDHPLYTAAFSPDGRLLAAAGAGRVVKLWEVTGSRAVPVGQPLTGPTNTIYSVAFSPDRTTLAVGSADGTVRLWNVADPARAVPDGSPLLVDGTGAYVESVAFSSDGATLAAGTSAKTVWLWHLTGAEGAAAGGTATAVPLPGMPLTGPGDIVSGVTFSPDGKTLAASCRDDKIWLWTLQGTSAAPDGTLTGATNWTNAVAFSPDGKTLAAGTSGASVLTWNLASRALTARLPRPQPVTSVTWDGPARIVSADADGTVALWSLPSPVLAADNATDSVAYSPDGRTLAVGGSSVQLWDLATHTLVATRPLPAGVHVNGMAFRPRGGALVLAVALADGSVTQLDGRTLAPLGPPVLVISGTGAAESVAYSPDGALLLTGADDGSVRLFDVSDPARPRLLAVARASNSVYTVAFSPDGQTVGAASLDQVVRLWRITGRDGLRLAGPPLGGMASYAIGLAFAPGGRVIAAGSADKHVYLWDIADPAHPRRLGAPLAGPSGYVWAAAFSPDGKILAVGATDDTVWLWNVTRPAHPVLIAMLTGLVNHVYSVAFSPDGRQLAATSFEGTVHLWATSPAAARSAICANLGQPLSPAEWASYVPGVPYHAPCS